MWTRMPERQQRGAQVHPRRRGESPAEAVEDRSAQEHELADQDVSLESAPRPPVYPAGRMEDEEGDNTPSAPAPSVDWDDVAQPRGVRSRRDLPLPEGK